MGLIRGIPGQERSLSLARSEGLTYYPSVLLDGDYAERNLEMRRSDRNCPRFAISANQTAQDSLLPRDFNGQKLADNEPCSRYGEEEAEFRTIFWNRR